MLLLTAKASFELTVIGKQFLQPDGFILSQDDLGFQVMRIDLEHKFPTPSARRKDGTVLEDGNDAPDA
jgi:hypothetical protein